MQALRDLLTRLADRDSKRSEATVQADVRTLLLTAPFDLSEEDIQDVSLESPVGDRRRIDVETGTTVIEVKKDLRWWETCSRRPSGSSRATSRARAGEKSGGRYVGVLTDGAEWRCYHLEKGVRSREVSALFVPGAETKPDAGAPCSSGSRACWRRRATSSPRPKRADPDAGLGAGSSSHALDRATLSPRSTPRHRDAPTVRIKRKLWARLLATAPARSSRTATSCSSSTPCWSTPPRSSPMRCSASIPDVAPASLLKGAKFEERGIYGVVEADFFDWVVDVPRGDAFVRTLARRLARFDWRAVERDVLKVLYESVITAETRSSSGSTTPPTGSRRGHRGRVRSPRGTRARPVVRLGHLPLPRGPALPGRGRGG